MELEFHTRTFYKGKEILRNTFKVKTQCSRHKSENNRFIFSCSLSLLQVTFTPWNTPGDYGRPEACSPEWEERVVYATQEENADPSIYTYFKIKKLHFIFNIHTSNTLSV